MRIVIDGQGAQSIFSRGRGIGRYCLRFVEALLALCCGRHEVAVLLNGIEKDLARSCREAWERWLPPNRFCYFDAVPPASFGATPHHWNIEASELLREKLLADIMPDFVLVTSLFEGLSDNTVVSVGEFASVPTAVVCYDLIPLLRRKTYLADSNVRRWYMRKLSFLEKADLVLTISESSRREVLEHLKFPAERVVNISSAVDSGFAPVEDPEVLRKFGIVRPYLMHVGGFEERKNFHGLIEAYGLLPLEIRKRHQLVLVGKSNEYTAKLCRSICERVGLAPDEVILTGYVDEHELRALYTHCHLLVYPSLHEGFGLPVLEAMSCGAPVIGSNCSGVPEAVGREDALFDPHDPAEIALKMEEVLTLPSRLAELRVHAREWARRFSWRATAQRALTAMEERAVAAGRQEVAKGLIASNTARLIDELVERRNVQRVAEGAAMRAAEAMARNERTAVRFAAEGKVGRPQALSVRVEGPFDSSYSLALLNRETAVAYAGLGCDVTLHSTEGGGDYEPSPAFLAAREDLAAFYRRGRDQLHKIVCARNLFPPRVADMEGAVNVLHRFAWEETALPREWVVDFNRHLHGISCLSSHVRKILMDNGVSLPVEVVGCGVDHWLSVEPEDGFELPDAKGFRFLHVSSCFPRKGVDVLLDAYGRAFSAEDDVTLVIKTFPNPHNGVGALLKERMEVDPRYPHVILIEEDWPEARHKALVEWCHCMVLPSRAEGFCLPAAEALLSGLALIVTGWGGQTDFCDDSTAWVCNFSFAYASTHMGLFDSVWAEPSVDHLASLMREVWSASPEARSEKARRGRKVLLDGFTWRRSAERELRLFERIEAPRVAPRVGWVSTWNTRCGIATYSRYILEHVDLDLRVFASYPRSGEMVGEDDDRVRRCWRLNDEASMDALAFHVDKAEVDMVVVQFNYGLFDFRGLARFLESQHGRGRDVVVFLHSTTDAPEVPAKRLKDLVPVLRPCRRLLVHSVNDMNNLKELGLVGNVSIFPHGVFLWDGRVKPARGMGRVPGRNGCLHLASFGFCLPHKGFVELVEALPLLVENGLEARLTLLAALYPVEQSSKVAEEIRAAVARLGLEDRVDLVFDFLPEDECLQRLARADLLVYPYRRTGEAVSGALRVGLASGVPVAVTQEPIFDDVRPLLFELDGSDPAQIASGLLRLIHTTSVDEWDERRHMREVWLEAHSWERLGRRLADMLRGFAINPS